LHGKEEEPIHRFESTGRLTMFEMQILVGRVKHWDSALNSHVVDNQGKWQSICPRFPTLAPPYRYADKEEAESMLNRLRPDLPPECKRVVRV
jgi:hypothetical protein